MRVQGGCVQQPEVARVENKSMGEKMARSRRKERQGQAEEL